MAREKIKDAGAELLGNRRRNAPPVTFERYLEMNDTLKQNFTTKAALWPRIDYFSTVAKGADPIKTRLLKEIYEAIPVSTGDSDDILDFVEAVCCVRDAAMEWFEDEEQKIDQKFVPTDSHKLPSEVRGIWVSVHQTILSFFPRNEILYTIFDFYTKEEKNPAGFNKFKEIHRFGNVCRTICFDLKDGWPKRIPLWQKAGFVVTHIDEVTIQQYKNDGRDCWAVRFKSNSVSFYSEKDAIEYKSKFSNYILYGPKESGSWNDIIDCFETKEKAIEYAKAHCRKKTETIKEWEPDPLEISETEDSFNKTSTDVKNECDLRGLNFGNWVTSAERLWHMKGIYKSFTDLASIMGVDTQWLGRQGLLGIAVGAQGGVQNSNAAAHFRPGLDEINLTKKSGAGSVAHEMGHFFDHLASRTIGNAIEGMEFLSGRVEKEGRHLCDSMVIEYTTNERSNVVLMESSSLNGIYKAMSDVLNVMCFYMISDDSNQAEILKYKAYYRDFFKSEEFKREKTLMPLSNENLLIEKQIIDYLVDDNSVILRNNKKLNDYYDKEEEEKVGPTVRSFEETLSFNRNNLYISPKINNAFESIARASTHKTRLTDFMKAADKLDEGKDFDALYWTTPHELFARGFSDYILYKLKEKGISNSYLVRDNAAMYSQAKKDGKIGAVPHLMGAELERVIPYMDALVKAMVSFLDETQGVVQAQLAA